MSITKNRPSTSVLHDLIRIAFPERTLLSLTELTEGMFNAAYRVSFAEGSDSILKIAAASSDGLLSNEINLMQAEVAAMRVAHEHGLPGVAQVQFTDFSRTRCSGAYFFMEALPGQSLNACRDALTPEIIDHVHRQVGQFQRRMAGIRGTDFCLMGDERSFSSLYGLMVYLFENVLRDAAARQVALPITADELFTRLAADRTVFDKVAAPSFVHWDMWEGNIFVSGGELSGVIDWERAMWADPLMDDRFRRHNRPAAFLEGYGQTAFTPAETRRILWYDVFLYITMIVECAYRQYGGSSEPWEWLPPLLNASWGELAASAHA